MATKTLSTFPDLPAPVAGFTSSPPVPATPCPTPRVGPAPQLPARQGLGAYSSGTTSVPCTPGGKMRGPSRRWDRSVSGSTWQHDNGDWGQVMRLAVILVAVLVLVYTVAGVTVALGRGNRVRRVQTLEPRRDGGNGTWSSPRPRVATGSTSAKVRWERRGIHTRGRTRTTTVTDLDSTSADATQQDEQD